ncbi:hypothetical protein PVK06_004234 [Gossypium arboreum]|uniref:Transmembrane protein 50A n=1 Tax=Gossypium arboreum TaxID=29729 RepID=A0ABR0QSE3_GOSAR|nr:hypothetical protein PVK06_004234 [Gossypium arboreum]
MDLGELWAIFGPGVAGAVFGAGWWFWVDAVVCSSVNISFVHYLPDDIDYSPYDEGEWRLKLWLFLAYVVSFVSLAASVGLLIQDSLVTSGPSLWTVDLYIGLLTRNNRQCSLESQASLQ